MRWSVLCPPAGYTWPVFTEAVIFFFFFHFFFSFDEIKNRQQNEAQRIDTQGS